ncbi:PREDICTED: A disintegrin and metalloproteinase with thrombospondin motifs 2 [Cyphomyrmex costatus]|uniref:A disintegrin and metalloproteinase with thrombospondin motifs 2 n=1 Tax=Cyphomyrmex costatus TaxID=456900 RepID=UPI0008523B93|nr:PREDICTED: A disintegrin and metalloproteinase with thrombospondin motifs 2 [Cyphomyrmex costatus]
MKSMFFIFRLMLIILLNQVYARNIPKDTEVILLPVWNSKGASEIPLTFKVFGQLIQLNLRRNDNIVSPQFQVWKHNAKSITEELSQLNAPDPCYYLHKNHEGSAAISFCQEHGLHGLIFLENVTLEITPLRKGLASSPLLIDDHYVKEEADLLLGDPHVVKRSPSRSPLINPDLETKRRLIRDTKENLTLELAVFFDEAAYRLFSPFLDGDDEKIRDMLLAYVNGIQALYHHPSLGVPIDISLIRLDIIQRQPVDLPHFGGERGSLLDSFCYYANARNPPEDTHFHHWDMGLYVTGLDLYAIENGRRNGATMGLAAVGGLCIPRYSCVIAELGVTDQLGKPYPSAGFTSVYIAAHEIGHNRMIFLFESLGMPHDSSGNACPKDGYIMSPSRGVRGETVWSDCSREVAEMLSQTKRCLLDQPEPRNFSDAYNHLRYRDLPGREWTAKRQCELLLRDKDADVVTLYQACQSLQCETPHRSGYYFAGPALDGTRCALGRECRGGECLPVPAPVPESSDSQKGSWSEWKEGSCNSGCLQRSKGARVRRRFCENRHRLRTAGDCKGLYYDVLLCKDERLCKKKRRTVDEFATLKCSLFGERLPKLDGTAKGLQAAHEADKPWMACAIFCRRKDIAAYYAPRVELNDIGLDPYFPDGTWCHAEEGQDYFCRQHHCLPENFRFDKKLPEIYRHEDDNEELGPQNAQNRLGFADRLSVIKYLTSGPDGVPLLTSVSRGIASPFGEDEWIDKDYIELPALLYPIIDNY